MTGSRRKTLVCSLAFAVLFFIPATWAQSRPAIVEKIAQTYGLDSFNQIEAIRYTWNGEITGLFKISRSYEWEPKTGKVSFESKDKDGKPVKVSYMRSEINAHADEAKKQADAAFTNDNYWLLFPLHMYWDTSASVTDEGMKKLPVGPGSATLVSVKYGSELGGYTPGDTWDLYVGKDNRVEYLVFTHGGDKKPHLVKASWTGYKKAGPLLISTEHRGTADGKPLHISITDISVKMAGSDSWVKAQ